MSTVRDTLLNLDWKEKAERERVRYDFYYYKGKCRNKETAKLDKARLGQSWEVTDNLQYEPTQQIINHTRKVLKKQARFMFSVAPDITYVEDDGNNEEVIEVLRKTIDDILEDNHFWNMTRKAFLMSTIEKRILLRVELNKGIGAKIKYERIQDFNYKEANGKLLRVDFFEEDEGNVFKDEEEDEKIYYMHRYSYNEKGAVIYIKDTYKGGDLEEPLLHEVENTGLDIIPCWLIKNGGELNSQYGDSDVEILKDCQNAINRGISDYQDALKFSFFPATAVIDGLEEDIKRMTIAPGAVWNVRSNTPNNQGTGSDNAKASIELKEYSMGNSQAMNDFLDRVATDMESLLDMPNIKDLTNIPSAKAMRYLYNDLICRCEEKWCDWEPVLRDFIKFLIEYAQTVIPVPSEFKTAKALDFSINFKHNYPLPSDEEEKKKTAMEEVVTGVRPVKDYIRDFSESEDPEAKFKEIIEEKSALSGAELGDIQTNTSNNKTVEDKEEEETEDEEDERKEAGRE